MKKFYLELRCVNEECETEWEVLFQDEDECGVWPWNDEDMKCPDCGTEYDDDLPV